MLNKRGRCPDAKSAGFNVRVPGGSHEASGVNNPGVIETESALACKPR